MADFGYDTPEYPAQTGKILAFIKTDFFTGVRSSEFFPDLSSEEYRSTTESGIGRLALPQLLSQEEHLAATDTLSEILTDRVVAGLEVIAPNVVTDQLSLNTLEPLSDTFAVKSRTAPPIACPHPLSSTPRGWRGFWEIRKSIWST